MSGWVTPVTKSQTSRRLRRRSPAELYVFAKFNLLDLSATPTRNRVVSELAKARSPLWGPDAWRVAGKLDLDQLLYVVEADKTGSSLEIWQARVLRDLTGRKGGLKRESWK